MRRITCANTGGLCFSATAFFYFKFFAFCFGCQILSEPMTRDLFDFNIKERLFIQDFTFFCHWQRLFDSGQDRPLTQRPHWHIDMMIKSCGEVIIIARATHVNALGVQCGKYLLASVSHRLRAAAFHSRQRSTSALRSMHCTVNQKEKKIKCVLLSFASIHHLNPRSVNINTRFPLFPLNLLHKEMP